MMKDKRRRDKAKEGVRNFTTRKKMALREKRASSALSNMPHRLLLWLYGLYVTKKKSQANVNVEVDSTCRRIFYILYYFTRNQCITIRYSVYPTSYFSFFVFIHATNFGGLNTDFNVVPKPTSVCITTPKRVVPDKQNRTPSQEHHTDTGTNNTNTALREIPAKTPQLTGALFQ